MHKFNPKGVSLKRRDEERLYHEYTGLRKELYSRYSSQLPPGASRDELMSYIDEQFIKLVREYEINSPVDFPGYIKTKLTMRVERVYVHNQHKYKRKEICVIDDEENPIQVEGTLSDEDLHERAMLVDSVLAPISLTDLDKDILSDMLSEQGVTDKDMIDRYSKKYEVSLQEVRRHIRDIRTLFRIRLQEISNE